MAEDWLDFGPRRLPTSPSQCVGFENVLELWDRLSDKNRSILEKTLRELPPSRFIWLEKLLDYFRYRRGEPWMTGDGYWFHTIVPSSSPALFRFYLRILTTPGCKPGSIARRIPYNTPVSHSAWWAGWHDWRLSVNMDIYTSAYPGNVDIDSQSDAKWLQLQKAMQKLPLDISRMIQDSMYESVFGPKDVILPYVDPKDLRHFSALNSKLYEKYHNLYYSENMWILADGPSDKIERCFDEMPRSTELAIRKVTIRWTRADVDEIEWLELEPDRFIQTQIDEGGPEGLDNMQAVIDYSWARQRISNELRRIWTNKALVLRSLDLDLLVVDATDAYGPNEEYLGLEVVRFFPKFYHNFPYHLEVWAPDEDLASQIYDGILAKQ